jgi:hypothetical protein
MPHPQTGGTPPLSLSVAANTMYLQLHSIAGGHPSSHNLSSPWCGGKDPPNMAR